MHKEAEWNWDSALQHQTQQDIQESAPNSQRLNDTLNGYGQNIVFYNRQKKKLSEQFVSNSSYSNE